MIAGEGLAGIILAFLAVLKLDSLIDISGVLGFSPVLSDILSLVLFAVIIFTVLKFSLLKKRNQDVK